GTALLTPVYAGAKGRVQKTKARHDAALLEKRGGVRKVYENPVGEWLGLPAPGRYSVHPASAD
ncbi:hypothetical protein, partial [Anaerotruncus massiliensis (ex Liu et al. 2021)]|uniref:hypothetical protein n=1 Tax=Anaerotruncus massiliensis (ex Liu et al. 2021) TaxID=2321404 RepID=UPI003AB4A20B